MQVEARFPVSLVLVQAIAQQWMDRMARDAAALFPARREPVALTLPGVEG